MDTRMRYIKTVYEQRSFTKAAEKLYISQPSLSAMVKRQSQNWARPFLTEVPTHWS